MKDKNPDMVRLRDGRLLLVYADNDAHWSQATQVLTILASDDDGRTWFKLAEPGMADLHRGDERLVTPHLSLLGDGRLVVLVDHDDQGHFHLEQQPGNWAYWSSDGGGRPGVRAPMLPTCARSTVWAPISRLDLA